MRKILLGLAALLLSLTMTGMNPVSATPVPNLDCNGVYSTGTYRNVTVEPGSSCTLTGDVEVIGGVHAKQGASNLFVHVGVGRNIQANGVTGSVEVGPEGCKYDPPVGNNVHVTKSHNVLICWVTAKNNIMVTSNDGKVTVRDSVAGNIQVSRNTAFVSDGPDKHRKPGAIRVLRNTASHHIQVFNNAASRLLILRGNSPEPEVK